MRQAAQRKARAEYMAARSRLVDAFLRAGTAELGLAIALEEASEAQAELFPVTFDQTEWDKAIDDAHDAMNRAVRGVQRFTGEHEDTVFGLIADGGRP